MPTQRRTTKTAKKSSAKSSGTGAKGSNRSRSTATKKSAGAKKTSARGQGSRGSSGGARKGAAKKGSSRRRQPDALELLAEDHRNVQKLFRKAQRLEAGDAQLEEIITTACAALTEHAELEERLFYPALREQARAEDLVEEATVEHDVAKQLIAQLQESGGADEQAKAMFKVLGEYVNHHIEEEEGQIFRAAKRAKIDLAALGEQMMAAKQGESFGGGPGDGGEQGEGPAGERGGGEDEGDSGARGRRAGAEGEERESEAGDEVDVETPGGRSGSRSSSRPTSH